MKHTKDTSLNWVKPWVKYWHHYSLKQHLKQFKAHNLLLLSPVPKRGCHSTLYFPISSYPLYIGANMSVQKLLSRVILLEITNSRLLCIELHTTQYIYYHNY